MPNLIRPTNLAELREFARMVAGTDLVPRDYKGKPDMILVAMQMGSELGLSPMQSVQNIAVIGGRPAVWGDAMLALCRAHPDFVDIKETIEGEGDARTAVCVVCRRGQEPTIARFSVADAKRAGLWGKNVWASYPDRMLQMRPRGFALRDAFADALKGLISAEEARDIETHEAAARTATARALPEPGPVMGVPSRDRVEHAPGALIVHGIDGEHSLATPAEWEAEWDRQIASVMEIKDADKRHRMLKIGIEKNQTAIAEVRQHYPLAAEIVTEALDAALETAVDEGTEDVRGE